MPPSLAAKAHLNQGLTFIPPVGIIIIDSDMIQSFKNTGTKDIFNGKKSKLSRKLLPIYLFPIALRKLDMLNYANEVDDLRAPPSNHLEKLKRDREGLYSIRINDQFRICFLWQPQGPCDVEIVDYH
jgi:proteic killer suppression protein